MKKILILIIALSLTAFNFVRAEEDMLESTSLKIEGLDAHKAGDYIFYAEDELKAKFIITNKLFSSTAIRIVISNQYMTNGHIASCCIGSCANMNSTNSELVLDYELAPGASTTYGTSYISMVSSMIEGKDTLLVSIYKLVDNEIDETDFVRFTATWDFNNGSIKLSDLPNARVSPNPSISFMNIYSEIENCEAVEIYDLSGKLVLSQNINTSNNISVNTADLISGYYFGYLVKAGEKASSFQFIKQ